MPVKVQADLPVKEILESENIFVMDETRAVHQDIRPLKIMILNLMKMIIAMMKTRMRLNQTSL